MQGPNRQFKRSGESAKAMKAEQILAAPATSVADLKTNLRSSIHCRVAGPLSIAVSRIPPWLLSERGCQGRRLSKGRRSPGKRCDSSRHPWKSRMRAPGPGGPAPPSGSSARVHDGQSVSGIQMPLPPHYGPSTEPGREDKHDTNVLVPSVGAPPVRREQRLLELQGPGRNRHYSSQ